MHIGICRLSLRLPGNRSLKDKRKVVQSVTSRVRNRFDVAIAEVDDNDLLQRLTIGMACVSNNSRHANEVISKALQYVQDTVPELEVLDIHTEMVSGV